MRAFLHQETDGDKEEAVNDDRLKKLEDAAAALEARLTEPPSVALVLGSGLSDSLQSVELEARIPWDQIPGFPLPTVLGHIGEFAEFAHEGQRVLVQRGRIHSYEGYSLDEVTFATRMYALLGIETLIVTNASGGINPDFSPGDLVLLRDHINMLGINPLGGPNIDKLGPRFPDMSFAYSPRLLALARKTASKQGITVKEGVYLATGGPSYETPAEIRAFRTLGADLVGMSTVPEVIVAVHSGMDVLGISCVTNLAAGVDPEARLSHEEVIETTRLVGEKMGRLLLSVVGSLQQSS